MSSRTSASVTPHSNDGGPQASKCCVAGCSAKVLEFHRDMCSQHANEVGGQQNQTKTTERDASKGTAGVHSSEQKTTIPKLPVEHGPNSVLPMVRRKTGVSGGVIRPESFYSKTNGFTTPSLKRTQETRSSLDNSGGSGPARKKTRLDTDLAADPAAKPDAVPRKPWDTSFNRRPPSKAPEPSPLRAEISSETGGTGKGRLPTNRTPRKFAPRIELTFKDAGVAGQQEGDLAVSDSPQANGDAARATSRSTASPLSQGKEFAANDSLRAWYQQRESVRPEQSRGAANTPGDNKSPFLRTRPSFDNLSSADTPGSNHVEERRATRLDNGVSSSSFVDRSPKASTAYHFQPQPPSLSPRPPLLKQPSIPEEHLEGWKIPPPAPNPQPTSVPRLDFDSLIYGQAGAAPPPPTVSVKRIQKPLPPPKPEPPDEPFFMHMDPRLHWPQPQTEEWYRNKLEEIEARGGRKANFGKAAQRMRERRLREPPKTFEESLPEKIRRDPAWLRALQKIHEDELAEAQANMSKKRGGGQRGPKAGRQGIKRQASSAGPTTPRKG